MLSKAQIVVVLISIFILAAVGNLVGCNPVSKHKFLTFFFDGVPPLEPEGGRAPEVSDKATGPEGGQAEQSERKPPFYTHEPYRKCVTCHGEREKGAFSRRVKLVFSIPQLCYSCHTDYLVSSMRVHGPVAVGECLFCHDPHKSKYEHLLKKPEPELCYLCHNERIIGSIPEHSLDLSSGCSRCHEVHIGSEKGLLKKNWEKETELKAEEFNEMSEQ